MEEESREIISELESLTETLNELPDLTDDRRINNLWDLYKTSRKKISNYRRNGEIESEEADLIKANIKGLEKERRPFDRLVSNIEKAIEANERVYAANQREIEELREELNKPGLSERKREDALEALHDAEQVLREIDESREETDKKLVEAKQEQEKINKRIQEQEFDLKQVYEMVSDKIALDAQTLYFAYDFFSSNPKEEIKNTINDYKDGVIDLKTLNERLQNLKVLLNSGLYDIDAINKKIAEKRKSELDEKVRLQEAKVRKDNNIDYYESRIKFHEEMLRRKEGDSAAHQAFINEFKKRIDYLFVYGEGAKELNDLYDLQMAYYTRDKVNEKVLTNDLDKLINRTGGEQLVEKEGRKVPNYFPEEYLQILDKITLDEANEKIDAEVEKVNSQLPVEENKVTNEDVLQMVDDAIKQVQTEKKEKEEAEANLEPQTEENNEERGLVPVESPKIEVINTKDLEPSRLERIKEWFNKHWKKVTLIAGLTALSLGIMRGSCTKAKTNMNSSAPTHSVVELHVPAPEVTPTPEAKPMPTEESQVSEPEVENEEDEVVQEEETPAPTKKPHKKPTPTPTPTPTPEQSENPTPSPTPEQSEDPNPSPTPDETVDPEMDGTHSYVLKPEDMVEQDNGLLGDSEHADETIDPQLHGNALYNPITNTWIDSGGNSVTQNPDGSFSTGQYPQDITPNGDGTVTITNPNMSPVEQENNQNLGDSEPPLDSQTVEQAIANGMSDEEAQNYEDFFDDLFAQLDKDEGRGGR